MDRSKLLEAVDEAAVVSLVRDLCRIPAYTREEQKMAQYLGRRVKDLGMEVTGKRSVPVRLPGGLPGTVLAAAFGHQRGHLDRRRGHDSVELPGLQSGVVGAGQHHHLHGWLRTLPAGPFC